MAEGKVSEKEMFDVFNMGVGLVLIADPSNKQEILNACKDSWVLGEIELQKNNEENVQIL